MLGVEACLSGLLFDKFVGGMPAGHGLLIFFLNMNIPSLFCRVPQGLLRRFRHFIAIVGVVVVTSPVMGENIVVLNPYEGVNWDEFGHYKAALHVHTLQSDGFHSVDKVTRTYKKMGFDILAITDHDIFGPNTRIEWGGLEEGQGTEFPGDPKPDGFPANTTWPWTDYGALSPEELGMVGIEANELTSKHHINSYFTSYGVHPDEDLTEDEQLYQVKKTGGLAYMDHPAVYADWWTRRPVEWYVERFQKHSPDYLVGIEVTNADEDRIKYDEGLWDQLLARLMPERPVWGFGADDMHQLEDTRETDSIFVLEELSAEAVREAMLKGQFYFRWASGRIDLRDARGPFPVIHSIRVDNDKGIITISASDYDTIKWISVPETLEPLADYKTSHEPWALGKVVHEGRTLKFRETPGVGNYVRAELTTTEGGRDFRVFTNPFGLGSGDSTERSPNP